MSDKRVTGARAIRDLRFICAIHDLAQPGLTEKRLRWARRVLYKGCGGHPAQFCKTFALYRKQWLRPCIDARRFDRELVRFLRGACRNWAAHDDGSLDIGRTRFKLRDRLAYRLEKKEMLLATCPRHVSIDTPEGEACLSKWSKDLNLTEEFFSTLSNRQRVRTLLSRMRPGEREAAMILLRYETTPGAPEPTDRDLKRLRRAGPRLAKHRQAK